MSNNRVSVEVSANVKGFQEGMNDATQSAAQYETEVKKVRESTINFNQEMRKAKKEVKDLSATWAKLDAEAKKSAFGQEMKRQLDAAKQAAAEYVDLQGDIQLELKNLASDTHTLDMLAEGMGVIGNVTSATLGVIAQFTGNEEDARKAIVAFTTAESVLNTVTQLQNALQMQSNTMLAVTKIQNLAAAAAANIKTAAEGKGIIVTKAATVAQAAFNAVANANPYVVLAAAILGIVGAIGSFIMFTDDATDSQEEMNKELEEGKKRAEEYRTTVMNASREYGEAAARVKSFLNQLETMHFEMSKAEIVDQAAELMQKYGIKCKNAADAESKLIQLGPTFIKYLELQAQAAAATALQMAAWSKAIQAALEAGHDISTALEEASKDQSYINYGKLVTTIREQNKQLEKQLGITKKIYDTDKNRVKTNKTKVDYDKGSLEDYENQLKEAQSKLKKKNLSLVDKEKTLKDIEDLEKKIEEKEIELKIKTPSKTGSYDWVSQQLSEVEEKLKKLNPKVDVVKIEELKAEKATLEKNKKEIEDSLQEVVITPKVQIKSDADEGSAKYARDMANVYKTKMEYEVDDTRYQQWKEKYMTWKKEAERLELKIEADLDETKKGSLEWLGKQKQKYQAIIETSVIGSPEWKDALKSYNELGKKEHKIELALEFKGVDAIEKTFKMLDGFHAIDNIVGSFESLTKSIEEDANAWDIFMSSIQAFESIMEGINTVTQIYNMLSGLSAASKLTDAAAAQTEATAEGEKAAAQSAAVAPTTAQIAANKALEASLIDLAAASIFAAHAAIPFAGVPTAASFIETMMAIQASVKATTKAMMAFANGGIVGGSSYSGDRILARVNSGEMVLNQRQQKNLFDLLDSDAMPKAGGANVTVQGVIHGSDLILVQKNTNKIRSKAGTSIKF